MNWRRDEYTDNLTGKLTHIEITPENDISVHRSSDNCDCLPVLETNEGVKMLIHSAFDGRELNERNNRERGQ